jgi:hypothetical protein
MKWAYVGPSRGLHWPSFVKGANQASHKSALPNMSDSSPFSLPNRVTRRIFPNTSPTPIEDHSKPRDTRQLDASTVRKTHPGSSRYKRMSYISCRFMPTAINNLPDSVLLHLFDLVRMNDSPHQWYQWPWHRLVHICQRWRSVIFASSNIFNLKLVFEPVTRLELLSIWPHLPIIIRNFYHPRKSDYNFDSVLMHRDRISMPPTVGS